MTYLFGANNSDVSAGSIPTSYFAANASTLCAGWFYPTTLTNQMRWWSTASGGNANALESINTTQLRWRNSNSTTRGDNTLSGISLTTNEWWFIALYTVRSGAGESLAVWQATASIPPTRMTVTNTVAGSGTFTNLVTFQVGNETAQNRAFNGEIGWITLLNQVSPAVEGPLITTSGQSLTTAEMDVIERSIVIKLWNGTLDYSSVFGGVTQPTVGLHHPMDDFNVPATPNLLGLNRTRVTLSFTSWSVTGITRTESRPPSTIPWPNWQRYNPRTAAR